MRGMKKLFFTWLIPLLWGICSLLQFRFPGDEYGLWAYGSLPGTWIAFFVSFGDIHNPLWPISVALVGSLIMAGFGRLLDGVGVRRSVWLGTLAIGTVLAFVLSVGSYPSIAKALSKNGSWTAYVLSSTMMGIYFSIVAVLILTLARRLISRMNERRNA